MMVINRSNNIIEKFHLFFKEHIFTSEQIQLMKECIIAIKKQYRAKYKDFVLPISNFIDLIFSISENKYNKAYLTNQNERYDYYIFLDDINRAFLNELYDCINQKLNV